METKRDGALGKNFNLPPQPKEGRNTLGYKNPKICDTPLDPIPPNENGKNRRSNSKFDL